VATVCLASRPACWEIIDRFHAAVGRPCSISRPVRALVSLALYRVRQKKVASKVFAVFSATV